MQMSVQQPSSTTTTTTTKPNQDRLRPYSYVHTTAAAWPPFLSLSRPFSRPLS